MAFTSAVCDSTVFGNKVVKSGCWTAASVTTGTVDTGLQTITCGSITVYSSVTSTDTPTIVTAVCNGCFDITGVASNCGGWSAYGTRK